MTDTEKLLKLIKENPDLPVVPMVDGEVCGDDSGWWLGRWGSAYIDEYYVGKTRIHFKDDDEESTLADMVGCKYYETKDGRDITTLSDEEWKELFESLEWIKAIVVYIEL